MQRYFVILLLLALSYNASAAWLKVMTDSEFIGYADTG